MEFAKNKQAARNVFLARTLAWLTVLIGAVAWMLLHN
jgi:hypothetical protein